MKLLQTIRPSEASADYLYARVRSRRFRVDTGGMEERSSSVDPMKGLRNEYFWVYKNLNKRLNKILRPVFEYEELRCLILALRYLAVKDHSALRGVLNDSLLNRLICRELLDVEKVSTAVAALERLLKTDYGFCSGLTEIYLRQGPGGLEQALNSGYLRTAVDAAPPGVLKLYFQYLIDMRNLLALYKHLHWQLPLPAPFVEGGRIGQDVIRRCWAEQSTEGVGQLARQLTGLAGDPFKGGLEEYLCSGLERQLKQAGRDPLQIGVLLDYLWRCRMVTRRCGVQIHLNHAGEGRQGLGLGL